MVIVKAKNNCKSFVMSSFRTFSIPVDLKTYNYELLSIDLPYLSNFGSTLHGIVKWTKWKQQSFPDDELYLALIKFASYERRTKVFAFLGGAALLTCAVHIFKDDIVGVLSYLIRGESECDRRNKIDRSCQVSPEPQYAFTPTGNEQERSREDAEVTVNDGELPATLETSSRDHANVIFFDPEVSDSETTLSSVCSDCMNESVMREFVDVGEEAADDSLPLR